MCVCVCVCVCTIIIILLAVSIHMYGARNSDYQVYSLIVKRRLWAHKIVI